LICWRTEGWAQTVWTDANLCRARRIALDRARYRTILGTRESAAHSIPRVKPETERETDRDRERERGRDTHRSREVERETGAKRKIGRWGGVGEKDI